MKKEIHTAILALRQGGVIGHATETCYGLACDAFNKKALARLYRMKKMPKNKPVTLLVRSLAAAQKHGRFNVEAKSLAKKYWPGPLTIIVKRKKSLPAFINPENETIGFRVPGHALSLALAKQFGRPLTTTSANISGQPSAYSVRALKKQFARKKLSPDLILDAGTIPKNPPSTIIDCSGSQPKILRKGKLL